MRYPKAFIVKWLNLLIGSSAECWRGNRDCDPLSNESLKQDARAGGKSWKRVARATWVANGLVLKLKRRAEAKADQGTYRFVADYS